MHPYSIHTPGQCCSGKYCVVDDYGFHVRVDEVGEADAIRHELNKNHQASQVCFKLLKEASRAIDLSRLYLAEDRPDEAQSVLNDYISEGKSE